MSHTMIRMLRKNGSHPFRSAFTLVELLVVIAIIAVLMGLLMPAVQMAREAARRASCINNQRQLGLAIINYHSSKDRYPMGANSTNGLSWRVLILPQLEQTNLYDQFSFVAGAWNAGPNREGPNKLVHAINKIPGFNCPSVQDYVAPNGSSTLGDGRRTFTSDYHGVAGPKGNNPATGTAYQVQATPAGQGGFAQQGMLSRNLVIRSKDVGDGLSNTFAVGEVAIKWNGQWLASDGADWVRGTGFGGTSNGMAGCRNVQNAIGTPYNGVYNDISFGSLHPGGCVFLRGDGSTAFVDVLVDLAVYKAQCSRNGMEVATSETN
ncbi:MAG: DUF1559 domain-containing protein [Planctomycetaceae bacterium]|nr:DUF1559 domain-containing protein [Planctomycetaceae bacterium]